MPSQRRERVLLSGRSNRSASTSSGRRPNTAVGSARHSQRGKERPNTAIGSARRSSRERKRHSKHVLKRSKTERTVSGIVSSLRNRYRGKGSLGKVFRYVDEDHSGSVDRQELERLLAYTGVSPTKRVIDALFTEFDIDGSGTFEYGEFIELVFPKSARGCEFPKTSVVGEDPRKVFLSLNERLLDYGGAYKPPSSPVKLPQILSILRNKYQAKRSLRDEFRIIDLDKNGTISKKELISLFERLGIYLTEVEVEKAFHRFDFSSGGDDSISYDEFINVVFPAKDMGFQDKDAMEAQGVFNVEGNITEREDRDEVAAPGMTSPESPCPSDDSGFYSGRASSAIPSGRSSSRSGGERRNSNLATATKKLAVWLPVLQDAFAKQDANSLGLVHMDGVEKSIKSLGCRLAKSELESVLRLAKTQSDSSGLLMKYSTFLNILGKLAEQSGGKTMKTKTVKLDAIKARGATVSNLGVLKHPATKPSRGELRRSLAMRKMYARSRPSTAPADVSRIRRLESTFSAIQRDGAQVPRKGEHTPVYDTRHLIVSKFPKPSPLDYLRSSQAICGKDITSLAAKTYTKQRMARTVSKEKLWTRIRKTTDRYNAQAVEKKGWADTQNSRMRTVIRSKILYYENLQKRFARDKSKRERAGL